MALLNKLGITDPAELARQEEKISKKKAAAWKPLPPPKKLRLLTKMILIMINICRTSTSYLRTTSIKRSKG